MSTESGNDWSETLDRRAGAPPLYSQIVHFLEGVVQSGQIDLGEYLPSQDDLALRFGVSRITIRNAMQELARRGTIISERAKGARVLAYPEQESQYHGIGFSSRYKALGRRVSSRIISLQTDHRDGRVARLLQLDDAHPLVSLRRVRVVGEIPVAVEHSYLAASDALVSAMADFSESSSLYQVLHRATGIQIKYAEEHLGAEVCDDIDIQRLLEIGEAALLHTTRLSYQTQGGNPIEYCDSHIISDYYGIVTFSYSE